MRGAGRERRGVGHLYGARARGGESEAPASSAAQTTVTDRLTSRRTYNSAGDGPTYSDMVLRESACNTVLSARDGVVPEGAVLTVQPVDSCEGDVASVKSSLGQAIALVYEAQLTVDGESVSRSGEVELGFAIPVEYQNGVVRVSRINDDGTLTQFRARRSGGVAYIETDALGRFALSVPAEAQASDTFFTSLLGAGAGCASDGAACVAFAPAAARGRRRRNGRSKSGGFPEFRRTIEHLTESRRTDAEP